MKLDTSLFVGRYFTGKALTGLPVAPIALFHNEGSLGFIEVICSLFRSARHLIYDGHAVT